MKKNNLDKINLLVAMIASFGSIVALFFVTLEKSYFNFTPGLNWQKIEPFFLVLTTVIMAFASYYSSRILKSKERRKVFIIYSHKDKDKVMEIEKGLIDFGVIVLIDYNTVNIGDNIEESIEKNIQNVNKILFITSQYSERSEWIEHELKIAMELNKQILPIMLDDTIPPKALIGIKYAKLEEINKETLYPLYLAITN